MTNVFCDVNNSDSFLVTFKKARKKSHSYIASRLKEYELTSNQIDVLYFLLRNKKYNTAKDIVEFIGVSKGLVSRSVDELIKKDYLYVKEDEADRRKMRLFLTESGKAVVKKIDKYDHEFLEKITAGITPEEIKTHLRIAMKISENLKNID